MCRLLGIIANKEVDLRFSLVEGSYTLKDMSERNEDGWGLGWYKKDGPVVVKEPRKATGSPEYEWTSAEAKSRIFVAHVRKATTGSRASENCHPFEWNRWLFAHNGSVDRKALLRLLDEEHRGAIRGETDSEVYFQWVLQNIERAGPIKSSIKAAVSKVRAYPSHTGLNFILTDGESLYAYREASRNCGYYSLYYLLRDPRPAEPISIQSKEVRALLESKSLNNEKAVLVCSEKLTSEENWVEIPLKHLLVVSSGLNIELVEVE